MRKLILKQLYDEHPVNTSFKMITYKNKFIIYNTNSSKEIFFLNDNFQIIAIIKLKKEIKKVIELKVEYQE